MDFPVVEAIIGTVSAAAGMLAGKAIDYFRARKTEARADQQAAAAIQQSETQQALEAYRELIEGLKADMKEMLGYMHELEKEHLACREENAALRAEVKALTQRVQDLEGHLKARG